MISNVWFFPTALTALCLQPEVGETRSQTNGLPVTDIRSRQGPKSTKNISQTTQLSLSNTSTSLIRRHVPLVVQVCYHVCTQYSIPQFTVYPVDAHLLKRKNIPSTAPKDVHGFPCEMRTLKKIMSSICLRSATLP